MYQPPALDTDKKYPVVLNIYGGPDYQLVTNTFKVIFPKRVHVVLQRGFTHICICLLDLTARAVQLHSGVNHDIFDTYFQKDVTKIY